MIKRAPEVAGKRLLSVNEVVSEYGISPWYWRSLIWSRRIPYVEAGRKHLLDRQDIETHIADMKRGPDESVYTVRKAIKKGNTPWASAGTRQQ